MIATLAAAPAGAATVVVDSHLVVPCCFGPLPFTAAPGDLIQITPTGWLDAPPRSTGGFIDLSPYRVENAGLIRAFFGSELQGLALGAGTQRNSGRIEAASLFLSGSLVNTNTLITGAASNNLGVLVSVVNGGPLASVGASASLENAFGAQLDAYGQMLVQGRLENVGSFRMFANGDSFLQVGVGFPPNPAANFLNAGLATFSSGTRLENRALVDNANSLTLQWGARMVNDSGASFVNRAGAVFDLGGPGVAPSLATSFAENRGLWDNRAGAVMELRALSGFSSLGSGFSNAGIINAAGDLNDFELANTGDLNLSGRMYRGFIDNRGSVNLRAGANGFDMEILNQAGGKVRVEAGSLLRTRLDGAEDNGVVVQGQLHWTGGILGGNGLGGGGAGAPRVVLTVQGGGLLAIGAGEQPLLDRDGVVVNQGQIALAPDARWDVAGEVRNAGRLGVDPGATLDLRPAFGQGTLVNQVGGQVLVQGQVLGASPFPAFERGGTIVNRGDFHIAAGGVVGPVGVGPIGDFFQEDGTLSLDRGAALNTRLLTMTGGTLMGQGTINGDVFIAGNIPPDPTVLADCSTAGPGVACFKPGFSPGHLDIGGHLAMGAGSVLELEVELDPAGQLAWDSVSAGSMSFVNGALIRLLVGPGVPTVAGLTVLTCTLGPCDLSGAVFDVQGASDVQWMLGGSTVAVGFTTAPVPEPAAAWLLLGGLGLLGLRRRRPVSAAPAP